MWFKRFILLGSLKEINNSTAWLSLSLSLILAACSSGVEDASKKPNTAPLASSVSIGDNNEGLTILGSILSGIYTYSDADDDAEGISTFRWLRGTTPIDGETTTTYTVAEGDSGQTISFEVTPVAVKGVNPGSPVTASIVVGNSAPKVSDVSIGGAPLIVGTSLEGTYKYNDLENDLEGVSTFRWLHDGTVAISGATDNTYTVTATDSGKSISFEVTPVAVTGTPSGASMVSTAVTINNSAPVASNVRITDNNSGTLVVGTTLTGTYSYGDIDLDPEGNTTFRWLRGGIPIFGATADIYTVVSLDSGENITFEVTPIASSGINSGLPVGETVMVSNSAPVATNVSINGSPLYVGSTLTGVYSYNDVDDDLEGPTTYRWLRNGTNEIIGATNRTYIISAADVGQSLSFEVTVVAATGVISGVSITSEAVTVNSVPVLSGVDISGSLVVGATLTGIYTYNDVDSDAEGNSSFRWLRNGMAISGAITKTYTLTLEDNGQGISFEVTPVASIGSSPGTPVVSTEVSINSAPVASNVRIGTTPPLVVGTTLIGLYDFSDADIDAEGVSTYRWLRNKAVIVDATSNTYTTTAADSDQLISFEVTPVSVTGTNPGTPVESAQVDIVNSAPVVSAVNITGPLTVGTALTATYQYSDLDDDLEGNSTYQWLRNSNVIIDATLQTYTLTAADNGQTISFEVTPVATSGMTPGALVSSALQTVNSVPRVSGVDVSSRFGFSLTVGTVLESTYTYSDADLDPERISSFRWLNEFGIPILGATNSTYTLTAADIGQSISVEVTPIADSGSSPGPAQTSRAVNVRRISELVGGRPQSVAIQGNYAYVAAHQIFTIIDISNPINPSLVAYHFLGTDSFGIAVRDNYVYVAAGSFGLRIIDISQPSNPVEVGFLDQIGQAVDVVVSGNYAYVAWGSNGLRIINIRDPSAPVEVSNFASPGVSYGVTIMGSHVYLADGNSGLRIIDVSNPATPTELSSFVKTGAVNTAYDVAIDGNYAYVAYGIIGMRVVDITNPVNPIEVGFFDTPGIAFDVDISGNYAAVADDRSGLHRIDISIPQTPVDAGFADTPDRAFGVAVSGNHAYVADNDGGLRVIDINPTASPTEVGAFDPPAAANDIAINGSYAYVADGVNGLRIIDVSDPNIPNQVASVATSSAMGVAVSGSFAYVADSNPGLRIIDISTPAAPVEKGVWNPTGGDQSVKVAIKSTVNATYAYVANGSLGLAVIDVTDPNAPTLVTSLVPAVMEVAVDLQIVGDLIYLASGNSLRVISIANPVVPTYAGFLSFASPITGVAVAGPNAYVANGLDGLRIVDVSNTIFLQEVGFIDTLGSATGVTVSGAYVYLADYYGGLHIYNTLFSALPAEVGFYNTPGRASGVVVSGTMIYIADTRVGMEIYEYVQQ